jgi:putative oxidoreductase
VALLLIRLTVGVVFVQTGWGKLHKLPDIVEFFRSLGIPAPEIQAPFVSGLEFFGGLALLLGLGARLFSVPLMFSMLVAILTAKKDSIESFTDVLGFEEWSYLAMFALISLIGPGKLSLDALLAKKLFQGSTVSVKPEAVKAAPS